MEVYFDNAATTKVDPRVQEVVDRMLTETFGNPSSLHRKGIEAEQVVKQSREAIAKCLHADPREIFFTSGGTESNNWALFGTVRAAARRGRHLIISRVEHAAVASPAKALEEMGFEVTRIGVDESGRVSPEEVATAVRPDTVLVSCMYVNNEIGTVQPADEIAALVKQKNPDTVFHVDAIQAFGKLPVNPGKSGIDLLSVSSHKLHGPKGCGFLYVRKGTKLRPLIFGGGQQNDMRSGTDNVPGIAGLAEASRIACEHLTENAEHMTQLRRQLSEGILKIEGAAVNGPKLEEAAPHIVNVSFPGIRSEVLLHALEDRGIYVSAGSACSSHRTAKSATLTAIGLPAERIDSAIRFSFCEKNTAEEVRLALDALEELVPMLRKFTRR
jgi:cysteine desulfurase